MNTAYFLSAQDIENLSLTYINTHGELNDDFFTHMGNCIFIHKIGDYEHEPIELSNNGDWIDLRAAATVGLKAFESTLIPLGFSMRLPAGYEAHLVPRSSTFKNFGIIQTNSIGIIDSSYCGTNDEWKMPVLAIRDTVIHKGDRICQFRIMPNMDSINLAQFGRLKFAYVDKLNDINRGGIGSTGIK